MQGFAVLEQAIQAQQDFVAYDRGCPVADGGDIDTEHFGVDARSACARQVIQAVASSLVTAGAEIEQCLDRDGSTETDGGMFLGILLQELGVVVSAAIPHRVELLQAFHAIGVVGERRDTFCDRGGCDCGLHDLYFRGEGLGVDDHRRKGGSNAGVALRDAVIEDGGGDMFVQVIRVEDFGVGLAHAGRIQRQQQVVVGEILRVGLAGAVVKVFLDAQFEVVRSFDHLHNVAAQDGGQAAQGGPLLDVVDALAAHAAIRVLHRVVVAEEDHGLIDRDASVHGAVVLLQGDAWVGAKRVGGNVHVVNTGVDKLDQSKDGVADRPHLCQGSLHICGDAHDHDRQQRVTH